ncbi:MAG: choice-of-anchor Q domain-containing protein [Anaerolineae bacterium]
MRLYVRHVLFLFAALIMVGAFVFIHPLAVYAAAFTPGCTGAVGDAAALQTAVTTANSNGTDDTITLVSGCTYAISATQTINADSAHTLTINTTASAAATIQGNNTFRMFSVSSGASVNFVNLTITGGYVSSASIYGGGILNNGTLTLTNSTVSSSAAVLGGGIYNGGTLTLTNSTVIGNRADLVGGGIENGGMLTLTNSTVFGNHADFDAGGIYNVGTLALTNSTASGNTATTNGGGIFNGGTLTLTHSTVSGNMAESGGGIYLYYSMAMLNNSIIANSAQGGDCVFGTGTVEAHYSVIGDGTCGISGTPGSPDANGNFAGDPDIDQTTLIPNLGSPVINSGNNALVVPNATTPDPDRAGHARIQQGTVDRGAFETAYVAPAVTISSSGSPVSEGGTATFTITADTTVSADLIVHLNLSPGLNMSSPGDYTLSGGSISGQSGAVTATIPAGANHVEVSFAALNDGARSEADETLTAALQTGAGYTLGSATSGDVTIHANGLLVTNGSDSGEGSLRQAVANANGDGVSSTITFSGVSTVNLTTGELSLLNDGTLTIDGGLGVTIQGNNTFRMLSVGSGAHVTLTHLIIAGGYFAGNHGYGGGLYVNGGAVTLTNSTVSGNTAEAGGGIYNYGGTLTLTNSTVSGNTAVYGGGIYNWLGTVTLTYSTVSGNTGEYGGGGIYNDYGALTTLNNSTVSGNTAAYFGGGIYNVGGTLTLTNSTVSGNTTTSVGGGIYNDGGGRVTLTNSTVSGNMADSGGGIYLYSGMVMLNNSIIANSTPNDCYTDYGTVEAHYSVIEDGTCGISGTPGSPDTNGNFAGDPGIDQTTLIPNVSSPVINSGNNALVVPNPASPDPDRTGNSRIQQGTVDRGAFETAYMPLVSITASQPNASEIGPAIGIFTLTRTSGLAALTVTFTIGGTATQGSDYTLTDPSANTLTTTVDFPANVSSVDVTVTPIVDAVVEVGGETVTLSLAAGADYDVDPSHPSDTVYITDGTIAPTITGEPAGSTVIVGQTATLTVIADGTSPLSYQWYAGAAGDTTTPVGTDSNSLTTSALTPVGSYPYWVRVSNLLGSADSQTAIVTAINDAPIFTASGNVSVNEDSGAYNAPWATAIASGAYENGQNVTFHVTNTNNALFSVQPDLNSTGTLTFIPATNANGIATVTVYATDDGGTANGGVDQSAPVAFTITVTPVSDPPTFTPGSNVTVGEDSGTYSEPWATNISPGPADELAQMVTFIVTNNHNALFSVQPAIDLWGMLTFTPAANANGVATVTLHAHDSGGADSGDVSFTITVGAVNDPPSFTPGGNVTVNEDNGPYSATWATNISPGSAEESTQTVTFIVTNTNNALFSVQPAIDPLGTLTFTPAANANGVATVTLHAHDSESADSGDVGFTITVNPVNDPPSFIKGADQTVDQNTGSQTAVNWATAISAGPADEIVQTVTFIVTNNHNALFSVQPAIDSTGTLTYTSAVNTSGSATVTVYAQDDGGTANGGSDTSAAQTFLITVSQPFVSVTVVGGSASEAGAIAGTFRFSRTGTPTADLTVSYTVGGTATAGLDYTPILTGTVTIPAGQSFVDVVITPIDDAIAEGTDTVIVTLTPSVAYGLGSDSSATLNLLDNDLAGFTISPNHFSLTEGQSGSYQLQLLTVPSSGSLSVLVEFDPAQISVNGNSSSFFLTLGDTTPQTLTFNVLANFDLNTARSLTITHTVIGSTASEYPIGMHATVTLDLIDMVPPPPSPTCDSENQNADGVVRTGIPDALAYAINCRVLYYNGVPTDWLGQPLYSEANLGASGLLDLGVIQAVDIFSPPPSSLTYFNGGAVFCVRGEGTLIWLAASESPRHAAIIGSYRVEDFPGFTCATLFEPGTLILVRDNPAVP